MASTASTATNPGRAAMDPASATPSNYFRVQVAIKHDSEGPSNEAHPHHCLNPNPFLKVEVIKLRVVDEVGQLWDETMEAIKATTLDTDNDQILELWEGKERNLTKKVLVMYVYWGGVSPLGDGKGTYTRVHDGNVENLLECLRERPECNDLVVLCVHP